MKSRQINIRVSEEDKARLDAAARERGFRGAAEFLRATALAGQPPQEHSFTVIIHPGEEDEGGYWSDVPALRGCHSTGDTYQEIIENTREAILGYIEMLRAHGRPIPIEPTPRKRRNITAAVTVCA